MQIIDQHSPDIINVNSTICWQYLSLPRHLPGPLLHTELLSEAVTDAVTGNLVTIRVDILNMTVVRPLVTHVEGGGDWATCSN